MNKMYEVTWYYKNDVFSHCTVTPITILRRGVLPGCTAETITAKGVDGRTFQGCPRDFFETEADAWKDTVSSIKETIDSNDTAIKRLEDENFNLHRFLCSLKEEV